MLSALRIENFAIVKNLELDFTNGLTAFTGETGAGKSIMIDALMLALGERADSSVIRLGEDKCDIQAIFQIEAGGPPSIWLDEHEITFDENLILRRVLSQEGRSKSFINGVSFPLQKVKELSAMLVDIHGQHQHQTLLHPNTHRHQLDTYADNNALLQTVAAQYRQSHALKEELATLTALESTHERQQLLQFQIDELEALAPFKGEMATLGREHQLLYHALSFKESSEQVLLLLDGDAQPSIRQQLHNALTRLSDLPKDNPAVINSTQLLQSALINADEALSEMGRFTETITLDPARLQDLENRMSVLHQTARKYHVAADTLDEHLRTLKETLASLNGQQDKIAALQSTLKKSEQALHEKALILRAARIKHASPLASAITAYMHELGMPKGQLTIAITPLDIPSRHGLDKVEYIVQTNAGTQAASLAKIASGGELSRISLAIQMITAQRGLTPTLLFDEVDVGIGGATAALVGKHLRGLGARLQVFCVTHQAQVAACAHQHYLVTKRTEEQHTYSSIEQLKNTHQVDEIARMLGGLTITEQTRNHAREMLTQSQMDALSIV